MTEEDLDNKVMEKSLKNKTLGEEVVAEYKGIPKIDSFPIYWTEEELKHLTRIPIYSIEEEGIFGSKNEIVIAFSIRETLLRLSFNNMRTRNKWYKIFKMIEKLSVK